MKKTCSWNDKEYPTMKQAATATGYFYHTMRMYIRRGFTCDADVARKKNYRRKTFLKDSA